MDLKPDHRTHPGSVCLMRKENLFGFWRCRKNNINGMLHNHVIFHRTTVSKIADVT